MFRFAHWAVLLWLVCLTLLQQEAASHCGILSAHAVNAYLNSRSEKLVLPWTVAIRNKMGKFKCLGSIIPDDYANDQHRNSSRFVLTAGSCFRHVQRKRWGTPHHYKVYAGLDRLHLVLNRGQDTVAKTIRIMPYNAANENIWNGVALVTLRKSFVFTKNISPVCVASAYAVPLETSTCFVSTYHKKHLDEDVVRMAPDYLCNFGHFPELARAKGLCSLHDTSDTEKSLGGALVCIVQGRAYQFGVYLSQLVNKGAFSYRSQALHYYGHITTVLETNPAAVSNLIQLGSSKQRPPTEGSSSSSDSRPHNGCKPPSSNTHTGGQGKPAPPPCARPTEPEKPFLRFERRPVYCGDTITFGRTVQSYVVGNNAQDMFPWNIIITSKVMGSTKCIGSLVHKGDHRQTANSSDIILTAADCFSSLYGLLWLNNQMRRGIAIAKLERPLLRKDNVVPICLAPKDAVPPPTASCYVTYYDKREHRIDEEIVLITRNARCLAADSSRSSEYLGICAFERRKKSYIQRGSPLVCLVNGRAYQYGVYLNGLSLKINSKVKQDLGFYSEMSIVHDFFAGKKVQTLPDHIAYQPATRPHKPSHASSSSSSASHEHRRPPFFAIPDVYLSIPKLPLPSGRPEVRRSNSSSSSTSSVSSSDKHSSSHEHTLATSSAQDSDESDHVIRVNVNVSKPTFGTWIGGTNPSPPRRPVSQPPRAVLCPTPGQRPINPKPGSAPSNAVIVCPMPGNAAQIVPLPTPLPTAEYPSSSLEAGQMVTVPLLPKYDLTSQTIAEHEHIKVQDTVVEQTAIAKGSSASCDIIGIGNALNSLLPRRSSGEITGNEIVSHIPSVTGAMITGPCASGDSRGHHKTGHLPGASAVHIFTISGSKIEPQCTGTLYVKGGDQYSDEVITASRCVSSKDARRYQVYIGSLLPRQMTVEQLSRTLIKVGSIYASPFYKGYDELKEIGMTVLKLKHRVKVANGVQSFPLPYLNTGASPRMECYVSGVCKHGMPVRAPYRLLDQTDCKRHLGDKFLPNVMYCGVGRKEALEYPIGSPLLCQSAGRWVQFGIYDHSFPAAVSDRASRHENAIVPDDIALFIRLEGEGTAHVQNYKAQETSYL